MLLLPFFFSLREIRRRRKSHQGVKDEKENCLGEKKGETWRGEKENIGQQRVARKPFTHCLAAIVQPTSPLSRPLRKEEENFIFYCSARALTMISVETHVPTELCPDLGTSKSVQWPIFMLFRKRRSNTNIGKCPVG